MEKRLREALDHLKAHARQSNVRYSISPFADGIFHAVQVIEAAMESELTQRLMDPQDLADPNEKETKSD